MARKKTGSTHIEPSSIEKELERLAQERLAIESLDTLSREKNDKAAAAEVRALKKNYAEVLSRSIAEKFANALRKDFSGILPDEHGKGHESTARASKRAKKLDVNYSNPYIGLGLGISIKTLNFRDPKSQRYTKNFTRIDNEWRAEASDYHERQPYAVMIGILFLPLDSVEDSKGTHSSFAGAVSIFRHRSGRQGPSNRTELFERLFIGLYETASEYRGAVRFFDVSKAPPRAGIPSKTLDFFEVIQSVRSDYDRRNRVSIVYEGEDAEAPSLDELAELQEELEEDPD